MSVRPVEGGPVDAGRVRVDRWGAALRPPLDEHGCAPVHLHRENGGRFPAWLMNRTRTTYLGRRAESVRRLFTDGGRPELRRS